MERSGRAALMVSSAAQCALQTRPPFQQEKELYQMFNAEHITNLEKHVAAAHAKAKSIGARALAAGRQMTGREHNEVSAALADAANLSLRLQHQKSIAGAFRAQAY
jgi:hypothetical protein